METDVPDERGVEALARAESESLDAPLEARQIVGARGAGTATR